MIFTVQHTCKKEGGQEFVLRNIPFLSEYDPDHDKKPFLGEGYYFWDYNEDYAKFWGRSHYNNKFYVCEADIEVDHEKDGFYLDLAGNRKHLIGFVDLLREFKLIHEEGTKGIDLCYIINYLRKNFPEEVFPFRVIRAVDYKNNEKAGIKIDFNDKEGKRSYTILNPRIIISFVKKEEIVYKKVPFIKFAT